MATSITQENIRTSPWDEYFDGEHWVFTESEDYQGPPTLFIKKLRYRASLKGKRIHVIDVTPRSFTMVAYKP